MTNSDQHTGTINEIKRNPAGNDIACITPDSGDPAVNASFSSAFTYSVGDKVIYAVGYANTIIILRKA
jgi:hypothetical protein